MQLAFHFDRAGNTTKAAEHYARAGDQAITVSADDEAYTAYFRALDLLERLLAPRQPNTGACKS